MSVRIAINGFGRIGRCVARAWAMGLAPNIELVAINGRGPIENHYHLLKYDSIHGRFPGTLELKENSLIINGKEVKVFREREPENAPWTEHNIDIVMECTGAFKDRAGAGKHLTAGAKKVMISAPAKGDDIKMIVHGVNDNLLTAKDNIISIGSCTTNCLAPVAKVLHDNLEILKGFVTTIHAVTNDQNAADASHNDLRRARAAYSSMIPTSTGAAKAIGKVIPELNGRLDGTAIRVPTANVSMIDFCFLANKSITADNLNKLIKAAAAGSMSRVLGYTEEELVSIDFNQTIESSYFDATGTKVLKDNFIRIAAWYDNEWAFSVRMLDIAKNF
ncbi:MAG: type I glyceraldehyde-3-phosphate dehydrogenase [Alphaproteobacteria bacterium]|jgi:glyceraldehyde 3-phosphate dehydrogenase|nr:type I glyceraldehyde-3-phosphate dehydrogenase [Alphaproteobacteria bacterium]